MGGYNSKQCQNEIKNLEENIKIEKKRLAENIKKQTQTEINLKKFMKECPKAISQGEIDKKIQEIRTISDI